MARNDMSNISSEEKALHTNKWVVFLSKEWGNLPPLSPIIASANCIEDLNENSLVIAALSELKSDEVLINHFILAVQPSTIYK